MAREPGPARTRHLSRRRVRNQAGPWSSIRPRRAARERVCWRRDPLDSSHRPTPRSVRARLRLPLCRSAPVFLLRSPWCWWDARWRPLRRDPRPAPPNRRAGAATGPEHEVPSAASVAPALARYRVDVTANPRNAELELDGNSVGTGRFDKMLIVDGAEHTLTVTAFGFAPAKLKFRDRPPPEEVSLEPAAPAQAVKPPLRAIRSAKVSEREHMHEGVRRANGSPSVPAAPAPSRAANNAAIIE